MIPNPESNPDSSFDSGFEIAPGLNVRSCEVIKLFVFFFRQNHDARFQAIMNNFGTICDSVLDVGAAERFIKNGLVNQLSMRGHLSSCY